MSSKGDSSKIIGLSLNKDTASDSMVSFNVLDTTDIVILSVLRVE